MKNVDKIKLLKRQVFLAILSIWGNPPVNGQNVTEILGRPTHSSVTVSFLSDRPVEVYWEYGEIPGSWTMQTDTLTAVPDSALNYVFQNLPGNTKCYYRCRYRLSGSSGAFLEGEEHSFRPQRPNGNTFSFAVEADPHLDSNTLPEAYLITLQNILDSDPDFMLDLGDNFMSEKLTNHDSAGIAARHLLYRSYYGSVCHSVPLFLVLGNHEGEMGWKLDGTPSSMPVMVSKTRKRFYPNPVPDDFYSGNTTPEEFVGLRQNYYSWEWGNCLFIVIDPYWYTTQKPDWGWTLGSTQFEWLESLLHESTAKFKFIFCHQLVGGDGADGRGGAEYARFFEMGGYNANSTWGFDTYRPGWGKPVHQMMTESKATIYFHGHDHCYARQDKDGIIYQEVPQPASKNISNITGLQYGYEEGVLMPNRGFLLVTVTDSTVKVDYIRTYLPSEETGGHTNGEVAFSYTLPSSAIGIPEIDPSQPSIRIGQNYPNPFRTTTSLNYTVISGCDVRIVVFDLYGREVMTLVDRYQEPGEYTVEASSDKFPPTPGIYFCRFSCGHFQQTVKINLTR